MKAEVVWWRSLSTEQRKVVLNAEEKGRTLEERRDELEGELAELRGSRPESVSHMLSEQWNAVFAELLKELKVDFEKELRLVRSVLGQGLADDSEDR
jgi:TRAP-type C4-dicarboxylate transport system substrate-binding protein